MDPAVTEIKNPYVAGREYYPLNDNTQQQYNRGASYDIRRPQSSAGHLGGEYGRRDYDSNIHHGSSLRRPGLFHSSIGDREYNNARNVDEYNTRDRGLTGDYEQRHTGLRSREFGKLGERGHYYPITSRDYGAYGGRAVGDYRGEQTGRDNYYPYAGAGAGAYGRDHAYGTGAHGLGGAYGREYNYSSRDHPFTSRDYNSYGGAYPGEFTSRDHINREYNIRDSTSRHNTISGYGAGYQPTGYQSGYGSGYHPTGYGSTGYNSNLGNYYGRDSAYGSASREGSYYQRDQRDQRGFHPFGIGQNRNHTSTYDSYAYGSEPYGNSRYNSRDYEYGGRDYDGDRDATNEGRPTAAGGFMQSLRGYGEKAFGTITGNAEMRARGEIDLAEASAQSKAASARRDAQTATKYDSRGLRKEADGMERLGRAYDQPDLVMKGAEKRELADELYHSRVVQH